MSIQYLETYLATIKDRGNEALAQSIAVTAEEIGKEYLESFDFVSNQIGLLFGNVQSGKTAQMFGIISKAADLGFPVFMLLTTDNVLLQQQTLERVQDDLKDFCVCGENDTALFTKNRLIKPTIIVLKKNVRILKLWDSVINSTEFMVGNPLFIVDDEADAASLNTMISQNRQSSINKYLNSIKAGTSSSIYLQVTGTPQALLLQAKETGWKPLFAHYFRPGKAYLGGDFFFPEEQPNCISLIDEMRKPLNEAVMHHLIVSAQLLLSGKKVCNFMIHPSVRTNVHIKFQKEVQQVLKEYQENFDTDNFNTVFARIYDSLHPEQAELQPLQEIRLFVKELLIKDKVNVIVMNGKNEVDSSEYANGSNIIIGGNTLGRGVTFGGLQTIYYVRTAKKPQADTMWQHSRMFGYDRDRGLMKVYIDEHLYKLFADINATNNAIIAQIERGLDNIKIYYPPELNPTRKNVLDKKKVFALSGGTNYFPLYPKNDNIDELDKLLSPFNEKKDKYQVSLQLIRKILLHITTENGFSMSSFQAFIDMILSKLPTAQGVLIVRRERNISKGSRALLSPTDWNIGGSVENKLVLTMYKMTGDKGWEGKKIWVPNIKLPDNVVYYDVVDENN
ncbi:Z1 domain-containing protein [Pectinatus frisingensis]|uniref:Z1 domain-containing protein n=1 Tax=Pectinatus frisingensis TaxID=865 RepID=UPI001E618FF9|nr:Z1 domain-containing protein [Pectinatus frisingensis]